MLSPTCKSQAADLVMKRATGARLPTCACRAAPVRRTSTHRTGPVCSAKPPVSSITPASLMSEFKALAANIATSNPETHAAKAPLSIRPITTHVNIVVAGSTHHVGKVPYYKLEAKVQESAVDNAKQHSQAEDDTRAANRPVTPLGKRAADAQSASCPNQDSSVINQNITLEALFGKREKYISPDPHAAFIKDPSAWASSLAPVLLPEACREMVYTFQDTPGQGAALNPAVHLECLLEYVLKQQAKDYDQLGGCRGLHKSLACGCLEHSPTVCIYSLPPEGPSRMDLLIMSALSQHVALMPVITGVGLTADQGAACQQLVSTLLKDPGLYVEGLKPFKVFTPPKPDKATSEMPILLPEVGAGATPGSIAEWLTTDWVYDILDHAWEKYNNFCALYEKSEKSMSALLMSELEAFDSMMPLTVKQQARQKERDLKAKLVVVRRYVHQQGRGTHDINTLLHLYQQWFTQHGFQLPEDEGWLRKMW